MRTSLVRFISRQPGYTIEVAIGTGEPGQAVGLHHRQDQGIAAEDHHAVGAIAVSPFRTPKALHSKAQGRRSEPWVPITPSQGNPNGVPQGMATLWNPVGAREMSCR